MVDSETFFSDGNFLASLRARLFANGRGLNGCFVTYDLLNSHSFTKSLKWVSALEFLKLNRRVLVEELVNWKETAADLDLDLVTFHLDHHAFRAELIDTGWLSHKHNLKLLAVRVVVDVLRQLLVHDTVLYGDVHCDAGLQVNDVGFECFNFKLSVTESVQEVKGSLVCLVAFVLKCHDVVRRSEYFFLEGLLVVKKSSVFLLKSRIFLNKRRDMRLLI